MIPLIEKINEHYDLKDSIKKYKGYKVKSPKETIKNINNSFKEINLYASYTPKNMPFKNYFPFSVGGAFLHPSTDKEKILLRSGGKGVTPILSKASSMAELIERFTGYGLLSSGNIHYYLSKMKLIEIWKNKQKNNLLLKNLEFKSMETSELVSSTNIEKYDNFSKNICYSLTDHKCYSYPEEFIVKSAGSNGLASGNSLEEATLHGIIEVIERISGFYFIDNLPKSKKITKDSVTHPTLKKLMESMDSINIIYEMFDFSHLFDIPVIITIFDSDRWNVDENRFTNDAVRYPKIIIGSDTNPQDAAMRCFTEFLQVTDSIYFSIYETNKVIDRFNVADIEIPEGPKLFLKSASTLFSNGNYPISTFKNIMKFLKINHNKTSFDEIIDMYDINQKIEIERIVKALKEHNIEVYIHDITHPILRFPVVRAIISGGDGYFSKIPFNGYQKLIPGENNKLIRYSFLDKSIQTIMEDNSFHKIIKKEEWCSGGRDLESLMEIIKADISYNGPDSYLWGINVNKFYFLGMLYLKLKNFEKAKKCFNAALIENNNYLPALYGMAYIFKTNKNLKDYENIKCHIELLNENTKSFEDKIKEFDNPVVSPNPLEPCDQKCKQKNKPHLCEQCFFNYVSEDIFMKKITDEYYK